MKKRTENKYSYTALLACSLVIAAFVQVTGFVRAETSESGFCQETMLKSAVNADWISGTKEKMSRTAELANGWGDGTRKSAVSDIYNNANIDRFNQAVRQMADNRRLFYLDVNELFDDEDGNLSEAYTADSAHVLGKYYADWVEWILKHAYQ